MIGYPENLQLQPAGERIDDRLRLFYVAMTRARQSLVITYNTTDDSGKSQLVASFLSSDGWQTERPDIPATQEEKLHSAKLHWHQNLVLPLTPTMRELLMPRLENYKLNATHLSNFLDLTRGGPEGFIINNLLRFPTAPASLASYGSAIHTALQRAHAHTTATGELRPHEDILKDFETALTEQYLPASEFEQFLQRGSQALTSFLSDNENRFRPGQKTELNFGGQGVIVGDASLTGVLDVLEINDKQISITDYKTGKPSYDWKGKTEYEKIKLHRYRMQLLFYNLLVNGSREFSKYTVENSIIQFVEPTRSGDIVSLEATFTRDECERLKTLIEAVWRHIITLEMPDTSGFDLSYKGILSFEEALIDGTI